MRRGSWPRLNWFIIQTAIGVLVCVAVLKAMVETKPEPITYQPAAPSPLGIHIFAIGVPVWLGMIVFFTLRKWRGRY